MATKVIQANGKSNWQPENGQVKPKRLFVGSPFTSFYSNGSSNGYGLVEKNEKLAEDASGAFISSLRKKLGEQHSYVGALLLVLVFSIIISRLAVFMGLENVSLKDIFVSSYAATQNAAYNAWTSSVDSIREIKIESDITSVLYAIVIGLLVAAFSWTMVFFDSDVPGENPPTPFSPRRNISYQQHLNSSYSLGYIITIVNGIAAAIYLLLR